MKRLAIGKAFALLEPGPVVLVATNDGRKNNVMTVTWTMVLGFDARFAIATGPWNYSYGALCQTKSCTIAVPSADMIDTVVGIGMCSGADTDKFATFGLTALKAKHGPAPLIGECAANIECRVVDLIECHNIVVLEGLAAYGEGPGRIRMLHAVGDGTFIADGRHLDRRAAMRAKIPPGL